MIKNFIRLGGLVAAMVALALPTISAAAAITVPVVKNELGRPIPATAVITVDTLGAYVAPGGGTSDATAANQATQITAAQLTNTILNGGVRPFAAASADWSYAAASGGISNTTTAVTVVAATASMRNYVTACQISADALGAATEIVIRNGAAGPVLWRSKVQTAGLAPLEVDFPTPIKSSANTLLEFATLTASVTGSVYINCQGYIAA